MASRLELQDLLENIIGNQNVYYNPPENLKMGYPAITYSPYSIDRICANNVLYKLTVCYNITIVGKLPNDAIINEIIKLPMCSFDRHYTYDGLHHDVLKLYF